MSATADLEALLASLKPRTASSTAPNGQPSQGSYQPSFERNTSFKSQASPALASPPVAGPSTGTHFDIASSNRPGGAAGGTDRTQNLLSLLKFSQPSAAVINHPQQPAPISRSTSANHTMRQEIGHGKPVKASDLMSRLFSPHNSPVIRGGGNTASNPPTSSNSTTDTKTLKAGKIAHESSEDALLKLLRRSTSTSSQQKPVESGNAGDTSFSFDGTPNPSLSGMKTEKQPIKAAHENSSIRKASPIRMFGSGESRETTPFEPPSTSTTKEAKPIFTYINPFEAIHASRNATPQPSGPRADRLMMGNAFGDHQSNGDKRKSHEAAPEQASTRRKLTPRGPLRSSSSVERTNGRQCIAGKLGNLVVQASKEAEKALEDIEIKQEDEDNEAAVDAVADKLAETAIDAAVLVKKELDKEENTGVLKEQMPIPVAEAVKYLVDDAAAEAAPADSWGSSDGPPEPSPRDVPVYNFPLKPFVSITINDLPLSNVALREDGVMEISRFKKDFDQLDRTLVSATSKYITYAFVKNGGIRVIRQDDGSDRQVFKNSGDRISHVTVCSTAMSAPPTDQQSVLGIGLSGTVYYATISKDGNDFFEDDSLDKESLVFPPFPPGDENSSGGLLKTRVRRSSRHPEYFAIGRGKSIHLIWPATAMSSKYGVSNADRTVDVERLYQDRPLKITTGKAGKDFIFSEDDTVIASLDKTGKLRFWDIRKLVNEVNATASRVRAGDVNMPVLSLSTASPAEKSWPTSVLFVDKVRPYLKGIALRYILVGLKQNHTLQLWDIGLGKVVQELNFPRNTETDGICSVVYHPNSGIIVVGHPTRNSIFLLHLSTPRYTLPSMSQASFLGRTAVSDSDLPKPDATACISGMREISFASKGHLRSIDLLPIHKPAHELKEALNAQSLFELYAVHSKGVTCLAITKEDLGWGPDSRVLHPIDNAVDTGLISLLRLNLPGSVEEADVDGGPETPQSSKASKKKPAKSTTEPAAEAASAKEKLEQFPPAPTPAADLPNGFKGGAGNIPAGTTPSEKDKKKKKKAGTNSILAPHPGQSQDPSRSPSQSLSPTKTSAAATDLPNKKITTNFTDSMASGQPSGSTWTPASSGDTKENVGVEIPGDQLNKEIEKIESSVTAEFNKQLDKLYSRIDVDRKVQDAANSVRQEAVLRLVSTSLSTNVENTLNRIIGQHIQEIVLPAITNVTAQTIQGQVGGVLARILHGLIPQEIGTQLPVAITGAMQNPAHVRSLTENISERLVPTMEVHFAELMRTTIVPNFHRLAISAAENATGEIENRIGATLQQYEIDRQRDATKIDNLQLSMQSMLDMMAHLTEGQIAFQDKILKDRSSLAQLAEVDNRPSSSAAATALRSTPMPRRQALSAQPSPIPPPPPTPPPPQTVEDLEIEEIRNLMEGANYEEASVRWLQSGRSVKLFDKLFINYTPDYLRHEVSPLVAFSVGITVANSFTNNAEARLDWIYTSLDTVDTRVSPKWLFSAPYEYDTSADSFGFICRTRK